MIVDLQRFIAEERRYWDELDGRLARLHGTTGESLSLEDARRLHYLYQRTSSDLAKLLTFAAEPDLARYLEALVARAYGEIHEVREREERFRPLRWIRATFPQTFRRRITAFYVSVAVTLAGALLGGFALSADPLAKETLLPFPHLKIEPSERVKEEESAHEFMPTPGDQAMGTSFYIVNNTRVSYLTLALGITWGVGTMILLFSNGVLLGAVCFDYIRAGETEFLVGWLLPHGATEIPAILLAGQTGLMLGSALIGWGDRTPLRGRLRKIGPDLVTLIAGVTMLLIWAGIVEAFFSQYHEPIVPYWLKIAFGAIELSVLVGYLSWAGRGGDRAEPTGTAS